MYREVMGEEEGIGRRGGGGPWGVGGGLKKRELIEGDGKWTVGGGGEEEGIGRRGGGGPWGVGGGEEEGIDRRGWEVDRGGWG